MRIRPLNNRYLPTLLLAGGLLSAQVMALEEEAIQSHDSIREAAGQFMEVEARSLGVNPVVEVGSLDSRLRLKACNQPLDAFLPPGGRTQGRATVGVRCDGDNPWSLYVPVTVSIIQPIVVAARELPRGKLLTAEDIVLEERDISSIHRGYLERIDYAVGKVLQRSVRRGQILTSSHAAAPEAVKKGSLVTIVASIGAIDVRMKGKALDSGAEGERILVRNERSKRELEATIVSPGIVEVTM